MFAKLTQGQPPDPACTQLQAWVRERFRLDDDANVLVSEVHGTLPGSGWR